MGTSNSVDSRAQATPSSGTVSTPLLARAILPFCFDDGGICIASSRAEPTWLALNDSIAGHRFRGRDMWGSMASQLPTHGHWRQTWSCDFPGEGARQWISFGPAEKGAAIGTNGEERGSCILTAHDRYIGTSCRTCRSSKRIALWCAARQRERERGREKKREPSTGLVCWHKSKPTTTAAAAASNIQPDMRVHQFFFLSLPRRAFPMEAVAMYVAANSRRRRWRLHDFRGYSPPPPPPLPSSKQRVPMSEGPLEQLDPPHLFVDREPSV